VIDASALRRARHDRGLSQRQLAKAIGVDPLTVQRLEAGADPGDLPLRVLARITEALAVAPAELLQTTTTSRASRGLNRATGSTARPLRLDQAKLLWRVHRGEDIRRRLSNAQRELVLPALLRDGLLDDSQPLLQPGPDVAESLDPQGWMASHNATPHGDRPDRESA
jgi:transcriptional regulator with XRE-family HTH domain